MDPKRHVLREVAVIVLDDELRERHRLAWAAADGDVLTDLVAEIEPHLSNGILVAHNARFDLAFLEADPRTTGSRLAAPRRWLCTASFGGRISLDEAARRFGVQPAGRHTAIGDADTLSRTLARMAVAAEERGIATVGGLVVVSGGGRARQATGEAGWAAVVSSLERVVPLEFITAAQRAVAHRLGTHYGERGPPTPTALAATVDELRNVGLTALALPMLLRELES
ncbi:MAG: hypothetical protein AB7G37_11505 [Solirubrobacteraceae bacterium]